MTRSIFVVAMLSALVGVADLSSQTPPPARTVLESRGAPLRAQLRPSDHAVRVVSTQAMPLIVTPPAGTSLVEWMTRVSGGAWLVRVSSTTGRLTDEGDFVETDVAATVLESLKVPDKAPSGVPTSVGDAMTFTVRGGEITIDGVRVQAVVPWSRQPQVHQVYLVFGDINPETGALIVGATSLYERGDLGFSSLLQKGPLSGQKLDGSVDETLTALRRAALRRE